MDFSPRSSGVAVMIAAGILVLLALLGVAITAGVSPIALTLAGGGILLFVVGAELHEQGSHRPPPGSNYPRIGNDPGS